MIGIFCRLPTLGYHRKYSETDRRDPKSFRYQESDRILSVGRILQDPMVSNIGLIHLGNATTHGQELAAAE